MIFPLLLSSALSFAAPIANTQYQEYDFNALEKIRVSNTSGKITVTPMPMQKVLIAIHKNNFSDACSTKISRDTIDEVAIEVVRPFGEICEADIELQVPKTVDLDITSGSGAVKVTSSEGTLDFTIGSGSIEANGHFKKVTGKAGSGSVTINGVAGGGSVAVGSGFINMKFVEDVAGKMEVKTGSGDATLLFPKGSKIKASLDTGSGAINNEFTNSLFPEYDVSAKSGSGDVHVKSY